MTQTNSLDSALAAARKWRQETTHYAMDSFTDGEVALVNLLAALDAARGQAVAWQYRFATPDGLTWSDWQQISSEAMAREMVEAFGKAGTRAEWRSLKVFEWGGYAGECTDADFVEAPPAAAVSEQLQQDIALVQATIAWGAESPAPFEAWKRIRARLTPNRERVGRGVAAMIEEWDGWAEENQGTRECFEASLNAAIKAMEGKE